MSAPTADTGFNLKHRITGAAILAVLATGFVALVVDEPEPRRDTIAGSANSVQGDPFTSRIVGSDGSAPERPRSAPELPELRPVLEPDMRLPVLPKLNTVPVGGEPAAQPPQARIRKIAEVPAAASPAAGEWLVRVASFADARNADAAVARLAEAGYEPGSAEVEVAGKSMVRVWVGPFRDRREALRVKADIANIPGLEKAFVSKQE